MYTDLHLDNKESNEYNTLMITARPYPIFHHFQEKFLAFQAAQKPKSDLYTKLAACLARIVKIEVKMERIANRKHQRAMVNETLAKNQLRRVINDRALHTFFERAEGPSHQK